MLDKADLQSIAQMMDARLSDMATKSELNELDNKLSQMQQRTDDKFAQMQQRIDDKFAQMVTKSELDDKLAQLKTEIVEETAHSMSILVENVLAKQFALFSEKLDGLSDKLGIDHLDLRVTDLEDLTEQHTKELAELKKAT